MWRGGPNLTPSLPDNHPSNRMKQFRADQRSIFGGVAGGMEGKWREATKRPLARASSRPGWSPHRVGGTCLRKPGNRLSLHLATRRTLLRSPPRSAESAVVSTGRHTTNSPSEGGKNTNRGSAATPSAVFLQTAVFLRRENSERNMVGRKGPPYSVFVGNIAYEATGVQKRFRQRGGLKPSPPGDSTFFIYMLS